MPDLGKYSDAVFTAYGTSIICLALLIGLSLWQARHMKKMLAFAEAEALVKAEEQVKNA
ncbi:MAG: heme exporter protein D [Paracoccaceae bacterium]|jgi:heme exporter protein D